VLQVSAVGPKIPYRGKGAALWKSQFVARGSILIFIDSDLFDFRRNFITGLSGALLENNDLQLIKASYSRPLKTDGEMLEDSGGRVTEILVRPLINQFLPELAELRQPLAGEYALRRSSLERMHFYSGYGVEIGLLLEYYFTLGCKVIGQVELGTRSHRNRPLSELSRMAFEIEHVFFTYMEQQGYCTFRYPRSKIIKVWEQGTWKTSTCGDFLLHPKVLTERALEYGT
jgi:glucosyl-3-phosphoglycerate synthase